MPKLTKSTKNPQDEQLLRFLETARALGCDEDKERFEAALGKIARHKPPKGSREKLKVVLKHKTAQPRALPKSQKRKTIKAEK
jgi:hypothetical protein